MFASLSDRLAATFKQIRGKGRLTEADIDETVREIRIALLDADVALAVVRPFCAKVKERALGAEVSGALNPAQQIVKIVNEELVEILGGQTRRLRLAKTAPTVILLAGLQGAGKTTLAGKLAMHLRSQGHQPMLIAADLQRPNAVDQLKIVGQQANTVVFAPEPGNGVGDPVLVTREGIAFAKQKLHDVVIVDTAGRLSIDTELMTQLAKVRDEAQPTETLLVIDAMTGQDAVNTAQTFAEQIGIDAVVLTKLDGDARGGAALSVATVTGRPIMYASTGEKLTDFEIFHPDRMASRILDMGDVLSLIEQAEATFDEAQTAKMAAKLKSGDNFTLSDFMDQMQQMKKLGSMSKIMGMMPGMGEMKKQIENIDDREIDRVTAIISSMTPAERDDPKILNGSRRARIARGSGMQVSDVNGLIDRFSQAQKMMKQMAKGGSVPGMPAMPAMPGLGGRPSAGKKGKTGKGAKRSGNPAKRAAQASGTSEALPSESLTELPSAFKDLLGPS
ncbi:MAG: signal recognition particle protein [Actinobacteria bacterium]|nr:signal recognition particle protein [Actinomycetota bacterium]